MKLIHDDALIRTAGIIETWLDGNGIPPVDWPPYSLYLNPIEHCWAKLKERICVLCSDPESFDGTKNQLKEHFYKTVGETWEVYTVAVSIPW